MIGNIIKKARLNQKLSQRELAKLTGVTQAGISKLELGGCDPSAKTMIKLTEVLGIQDKLFPTTNIDDKIDVDLEKRIERRVESRLEERLETRLESRLKEDITQDLLNELRKEIQVEFDRKFDPI
ncbi:MAG TPA: helix-turn-helix domain-containing protein, partial [Planctomycetota bacterium]|nr:helix-turn-helix domain-containing protein [Planctomycetota bacterium]